ncbi:MAG: PQQ-binding-like beta-propeller repeat protein [Euryarchaeota archaeon]|nr:PQQ-binding-like beta-propeller repeat protein [Euryarchaeota archaeon]MDE1835038.1 PQQ-binding-like beta-propeller repeat protein [Euryarchaeota archaeon]
MVPGSVAHPTIAGAASWTQFHGDAALTGTTTTGAPGGTTLYSVDLTRDLGAGVADPLGNDFPYQASPVTDGTSVYVALNNAVVSVSAASGSFEWLRGMPGGSGNGPVVGTPLLDNGMLYLDQDGGPNELAALYPGNGTIAWTLTSPSGGNPSASSVVEEGGMLVLADTSGGFFWHPPSSTGLWGAPAVPGVAEYFATPSFTVVNGQGAAWVLPDRGNRSLDAWSLSGVPLPGFPVATGQSLDRLFSSAALVNLTAPSGAVSTWAIFGGEGGTGAASHLYAVDVSLPQGVLALTVPALGSGDAGVRSTPAVVASGATASIYFGSRAGTVSSVELDPFAATPRAQWTWVWNASTGGPVEASPVVVGGEVIAPSEDGNVYGLALGTGVQLWRVGTGAPIYASPALAGGVAWVVNANGLLTAIGGVGPSSPPGGSPGPSPTSDNSLASMAPWLIAAVAVAALALFLIVGYVRRRRRPHVGASASSGSPSPAMPPAPPPPPPPPPPAQRATTKVAAAWTGGR